MRVYVKDTANDNITNTENKKRRFQLKPIYTILLVAALIVIPVSAFTLSGFGNAAQSMINSEQQIAKIKEIREARTFETPSTDPVIQVKKIYAKNATTNTASSEEMKTSLGNFDELDAETTGDENTNDDLNNEDITEQYNADNGSDTAFNEDLGQYAQNADENGTADATEVSDTDIKQYNLNTAGNNSAKVNSFDAIEGISADIKNSGTLNGSFDTYLASEEGITADLTESVETTTTGMSYFADLNDDEPQDDGIAITASITSASSTS